MKRMLTGVGQGEQNVVSSEKMLRLLLYTGQLLDQQQHVHIGAYIFTASISLRLTAPSSSIPLALIELSPKSIPFYKCFKCSGQALSYVLARYFYIMNNKDTNSRRYFTQPIRKVQYAGSEMKHIFTRNVHENNMLAASELKQFYFHFWRNICVDLNEKDAKGRWGGGIQRNCK